MPRQRVIAGADILDRDTGIKAGSLNTILKRPPDIVIELIARRHRMGLLGRKLHEFGIEGDRAEAVIGAITGNHRLCRAGIHVASLVARSR